MTSIPSPEPVYRMMDSNSDALIAIDEVFANATREVSVFDVSAKSLRERGMGRPARIDLLRAAFSNSRAFGLRIVLHEVAGIESELPRLLTLMQLHSTQLRIQRTIGQAREAKDVMLIADAAHCWRKPYFEHPRSVLSLHDLIAARPFVDRFEEIWESTELVAVGSATGL
jgi:hypothetical protein